MADLPPRQFEELVEALPDAIFYKDGDGRWCIANAAARRIFQLDGLPWQGKTDEELATLNPDLKQAFAACPQDDARAWQEKVPHDAKGVIRGPGASLPFIFDVTKIPMFSPTGERRGLVISGHDVSARVRAEASLRRQQSSLCRLNEIAALTHLPIADQLRLALKAGCEHLELPIGIVSRVDGDSYEILSQIAPSGMLTDHQRFPLGDTYCAITLDAHDVVAIDHMGTSEYKGHPCYQTFPLETYIAAPLMVKGQTFGTVNFSSPQPYSRHFDEGDKEFVALLARWVGSAMERHQMEERLAANERELRAIIENEPECVKVLGPDGQLESMNRAGLAMLEADSVADIQEVGLINFVTASYRQQFRDLHQSVFAGKRGSLEFEVIGKQGTHRWLETHAAPLVNANGSVISLVAITRDVTQRKLSDDQLRASERRYRSLFQNMQEGMVHFRVVFEDDQAVDLEYIAVNPAFAKLVGLRDVVGKRVCDLFPNFRQDNMELMARYGRLAQEEGRAEQFEMFGPELQRWYSVSAYSPELAHVVAVFEDITERKLSEEQILKLAYFDSLTGLANRRMMEDRLNQGLTQAVRHGRSLAVMFLDLDDFKKVNDSFGHSVGDQLLKEVAQRLSACVRAGDTISRSGGDEFIIILPEIAAPEDAAIVARKILEALAKPILLAGQQLSIGTSIGIAVYPVNGTDDMDALMKKADQAMYEVKRSGRNGFRFYLAVDGNDPVADKS